MWSTLFRAVVAVVAGVLMVMYPSDIARWFTILFGVLFFISGFVSIVWYYVMLRRYNRAMLAAASNTEAEKESELPQVHKPAIPIVGIGCALLGLILALMPETVNDLLVYVFAVIIILGAISEFIALISVHIALNDCKKTASSPVAARPAYGYYILPALLLIFGIVALIYGKGLLSVPYICLGIAFIVYGLSEVISLIKT
ncbi:MAG: DUF308 domain-containing protein, partial [Prevotella sp.]|nr:DUF308 domain-containing protein [Prevotella sp.]